jgi:argonaute-like protein implicated in RNA metabolism and viral defense
VRRFRHKFDDVTVPDGKTIDMDITMIVLDINEKNRIKTTSDEVSTVLQQSQELLRRLAQTTARTATKILKLKLYKTAERGTF